MIIVAFGSDFLFMKKSLKIVSKKLLFGGN